MRKLAGEAFATSLALIVPLSAALSAIALPIAEWQRSSVPRWMEMSSARTQTVVQEAGARNACQASSRCSLATSISDCARCGFVFSVTKSEEPWQQKQD